MNNKFLNIYLTAFIALFAISCDDYLEKSPDNRTEIKDKESVSELLVSAYPNKEYFSLLEPMTDNFGYKGNSNTVSDIRSVEEAYYWKDHTTEGVGTPQSFWDASYNAIAHANAALVNIEKIGGDLAAQKAEALFCRAYNFFMLTNVFGQQYNPATAAQNLAVPFIDKPESKVFNTYKRETVAKMYELIQKDLEEGLALIATNKMETSKYKFNLDAIYAFASRFYLYTAQWDKVVEYANKVNGVETNLRDWNGVYQDYTYSELKTTYTKTTEGANLLMASTFSSWSNIYLKARYGLTVSIKDQLFPFSDSPFALAYKVFGTELVHHIPKFDLYFRYTDISSGSGYHMLMCPLFTIEEVLLNRAEAKLMSNKYTRQNAIDDINIFLKARSPRNSITKEVELIVANDTYINTIYNADKTELTPYYTVESENLNTLKYILDLRRREFIYEGLRWFDVKRFNIEIFRTINNTKDVLVKDDERRAIQIPSQAIASGMQPNPRKK